MDQESRRRAERNQIGQGIEFAAKRALDTAHAGHTAIEQIKDAGEQNKSQGNFDLSKPLREIRFDDASESDKSAEEVSSGEKVGKEINLQLRLGRVDAGRMR